MAFKPIEKPIETTGQEITWGKYEPEAMTLENEIASKNVGDFIKLAQGNNVVRVLPPKLGRRSPWSLVHVHYIELPDEGGMFRFACPKQMAEQYCPVCDVADKLKRSGNRADFEAAKNMFPRFQANSNAIDYRCPNLGPRILSVGKTIWKMLKDLFDDVGDYSDPETGYPINIKRTGTGKNDTEYNCIARATSKLENFEWLESMHDVHTMNAVLELDELYKALAGTEFAVRNMPRVQQSRQQAQLPSRTREQPQERPQRPKTVAASIDDVQVDDEIPY